MSDMRAKIAISSTIATIAVVVGMFSFAPIVSGIQADYGYPTSSSMGLVGHLTLVITDPDGNVKYYGQTDNAVFENTKECMIDLISATTQGTDCTDAANILLGGKAAPAFNEDTGMQESYANTNTNPTVAFAETRVVTATANAGTAFSQSFGFSILETLATNPVGCVADSDGDGLVECTISEVGLETAGNTLIARAGPTVAPTAEAGDTIAATYTIGLA